jgi:hypothetical protein
MASLEKFVGEATRINVTDPLKRISAAGKGGNDVIGAASNVVGETVKEFSLLPLRNVGAISSYIWKKSFSVLGSVLKTGAQAAMLVPIPLPMPGGARNIAEVRGNVTAFRRALDLKATGTTPESFREVFDRVRGIRNDAESRSIRPVQAA